MPTIAQTEQRKKALKPIRKGELTSEEAKKRGSNGGKKSVIARREQKEFRKGIAERMSAKDFEEICDNAIERAKKKKEDFEMLLDVTGQSTKKDTNITIEGKEFVFNFTYSK